MFREVLEKVLTSTPGAKCVLFLDWEGETVAMISHSTAADHDLKVVGAYQGIFLTRLRDMCLRLSSGAPVRFKVEFQETIVFSLSLKDGYYLVLIADTNINEGVAWHHLDQCAQRLLAEI